MARTLLFKREERGNRAKRSGRDEAGGPKGSRKAKRVPEGDKGSIKDMKDAEKKAEKKNVVSLAEKRAEFNCQQKEKEFKGYLSKLKLSELRHESNFIIDRMGEENLEDEFLLKGALLMEELAKRIEGDKMSKQVSLFAQTLKDKMEKDKMEKDKMEAGPVYH